MKSDTIIERNSNMLVADMDGELVMMDVDQGSYFSVNPVGAHVWTQLETPHSIAGLIESVHKAFNTADAEQVSEDVKRFLADLASHGLVREVIS